MKKLTTILFICIYTTCLGQGFWTQKSDVVIGSIGYASSASFSIGDKGYLCNGINTADVNVLLEYNSTTNTWTQKSSFPGLVRRDSYGFSVGNKGYVGMGHLYDGSYTYYNDFYEYDPALNTWTAKASFPGNGRKSAIAFTIGDIIYYGGGTQGTFQNDFWQYSPATNTWTQKNNLPFTMASCASFSVGNYGYAGTGSKSGSTYCKDFWQYDPSNDTWTQKADFGGVVRYEATGFSMYNYGYIGAGNNSTTFCYDFWEYNPALDTWTQIAVLPAAGRRECISFAINNKAYVATGYDGNTWNYLKDCWEYTPSWYGIENKSADNPDLELSPNPASDLLSITIPGGIRNPVTIEVYNALGSVFCSRQQINDLHFSIDVSEWEKGIYYIRIQNESIKETRKFIKL